MSLRGEAEAIVRLATGNAGFLAGGLATNVVVARVLGPAQFGRFGILLSVATLTSIAVISGIPHLVSIALATRPNEGASAVRAARQAQARIGGVLALLLLIASPLVSTFSHVPWNWEWAGSFVVLAGFAWFYLGTAVLNGLSDTAGQGIALAGSAVARLLLAALGAFMFGLLGALLGVGLGLLLSAAWAEARAKPRLGPAPTLEPLHFRAALPIVAGALFTAVASSIDLLIVGHAAPQSSAGRYFAAATLGRIPFYAAMAVSSVYYPAIAAAARPAVTEVVRRAALVATALALLPALALALAGRPLLVFLYGASYGDARTVLAVLAFAGIASGLAGLLAAAAIARRSFWLATWTQAGGCLVVLMAGLWSVRWNQLLGPALSVCAGAFATLLALLLLRPWARRAAETHASAVPES